MDMEIIKAGMEKTKEISVNIKDFDPDKRVEEVETKTENKSDSINESYDPDKRIGISESGDKSFKDKDERPKELSQRQKNELISKGMSPGIVGDCTYKDGVYYLKTTFNKFEGRTFANTGIAYVRKTIEYFGRKIEGVFPKFDSVYTAQLPSEMLKASDTIQFGECNRQLQDAIKNNLDLKNSFSSRQLEQIARGKNPGGYTWHHNEEVGKMELVKSDVHAESWHTGGRAIWGGGSQAR